MMLMLVLSMPLLARPQLHSEYVGLIENTFQHLENFKQTYLNSPLAHKQKLISSIYPEKIDFDGKKCRTIRINDFLRYILQIDKELPERKIGQISKNMSLSRLVENRGVKSNYFGVDLCILENREDHKKYFF